MVLVLDEDLGAEQLVQGRVAVERRRSQVGRDPPPRLQHVGQRGYLPLHAPSTVTCLGEPGMKWPLLATALATLAVGAFAEATASGPASAEALRWQQLPPAPSKRTEVTAATDGRRIFVVGAWPRTSAPPWTRSRSTSPRAGDGRSARPCRSGSI